MSELKKIYWLIKKDLLSLKRHPPRIVAMIVFPLIMMLLFGYGMGGELSNLPIVVVSQDNGQLSNMTLETIKDTDVYKVVEVTDNIDNAKQMVDDGKVKAAIILPADYDSNSTGSKAVTLYLDSSDQMASQVIIPTTQGIFSKISAMASQSQNMQLASSQGTVQLSQQNASANHNTDNTLNEFSEAVSLHITKIYGNIRYMDFLVPAILGMTIMMSCMMGMGSSIAGERETGELPRLFMTPTNISTVIGGKIISKLLVELVKALILLGLAIFLFNVSIKGGIIPTFILLVLGAICFVGFGVMLSARTSTQEDYTQMVMPFCMPMMFVSGVFYPIETMPWIFQKIAYIFPLTYLNDAMRGVMLKGQTLGDVWIDIVILIAFTLLFFIIGVKTFNRDV